MTEIPPPLGDDDMSTEGLPDDADNPMLGGDADSSDGDSTDATDGDSTDADGTDGTDGGSTDADGTDGTAP